MNLSGKWRLAIVFAALILISTATYSQFEYANLKYEMFAIYNNNCLAELKKSDATSSTSCFEYAQNSSAAGMSSRWEFLIAFSLIPSALLFTTFGFLFFISSWVRKGFLK